MLKTNPIEATALKVNIIIKTINKKSIYLDIII